MTHEWNNQLFKCLVHKVLDVVRRCGFKPFTASESSQISAAVSAACWIFSLSNDGIVLFQHEFDICRVFLRLSNFN